MARSDAFLKAMTAVDKIRNIAICAHIDHGKTTFCDGLLAGAGMMSEELAGSARQLDYRADEIERGITIDAAATSMLFRRRKSDGNEEVCFVNLIDTPGHVDFGGDVTRAMRAVDGCIVLVDAVEGVMPQTETVLRQALLAYVKPILFINKVDRLIRELKLTPEAMQQRFATIIESVNRFIESTAPVAFSQSWQVSIVGGSVLFGSAIHNWALSLHVIKDKSVSLNQIIEIYAKGDDEIKKLRRIVPLHECVIDAVVSQLPNPISAAHYRIAPFWHGDLSANNIVGISLRSCDAAGPLFFFVTKIEIDATGAETVTGRIFSGTLIRGATLFALHAKKSQNVAQLFIRNGAKKEQVDSACAGNIISITGLNTTAGETLSSIEGGIAFDEITHLFEPVITKAIEPQRASELQQLEIALTQMQKEDPGLVVDVNKETGEYLISGYGELHLEIIENRIRDVKKIAVRTSAPLIVYREEISGKGVSEQTSQLDSSCIRVTVNKLPDAKGETGAGVDAQTMFRGNALCCKEKLPPSIIDAFCDIMRRGPLAGEPCNNVCVTVDKFVGENTGITYPLFKEAVRQAIISAGLQLLEPMQELQMSGPATHMGDIISLITSRKGDVLDVVQNDTGEYVSIIASIPVAHTIGMTNDLRACTNGRASISLKKQFFAQLDEKEQSRTVRILREKKGFIV